MFKVGFMSVSEYLSVSLLCSVYVCLCVSYVWHMSVSRLLPGSCHCLSSCSVSPLRDTTAIGVWRCLGYLGWPSPIPKHKVRFHVHAWPAKPTLSCWTDNGSCCFFGDLVQSNKNVSNKVWTIKIMFYIYPVSIPESRCGSGQEDDSYHYSGKMSVSYAVF